MVKIEKIYILVNMVQIERKVTDNIIIRKKVWVILTYLLLQIKLKKILAIYYEKCLLKENDNNKIENLSMRIIKLMIFAYNLIIIFNRHNSSI